MTIYAITNNNLLAVVEWGESPLRAPTGGETAHTVSDASRPIIEAQTPKYTKVVSGAFVAMTTAERDAVDAYLEQKSLDNLEGDSNTRLVTDYTDLPNPPPRGGVIVGIINGPDTTPCIAISALGAWRYINIDGSF